MERYIEELERLFQSEKEDVVVINDKEAGKYRREGFKAVVFDFDGVLLIENDSAEKGYAWLSRSLREGNFNPKDIGVSKSDVEKARAFRPNIKGKSMAEKVEAFNAEFGKGVIEMPVDKLIRLWFDALKYNVMDQFGNDPNAYRMPGAKVLLETAASKAVVLGVTANEFFHAHFLMDFVGFKDFFSEIVGYPINAFPKTSKASLLADVLFRHGINSDDACYIGDGASDIKAGKKARTFTIGIANATMPITMVSDAKKEKIIEKSMNNARKLIEADCDILATSVMAYTKIAEFF
jgi:phosphoglycolate phosphatase-like HAD superfamily hydrolase